MRKVLTTAAAAAIAVSVALPAMARDVTADRLLDARSEPQNWLMVHQDYSNWRHSSLRQINRNNVQDLEVKFMFSIGGWITAGADYDPGFYGQGKEEAVPLVDDGFMYVPDHLNKVLKVDVRSGTKGEIVWRFDPGVSRNRTTRGVALMNNNVYLATNDMRLISIDRESGEALWDVNITALTDPETGTPSPDTQQVTVPPAALATAAGRELILVGESSGGTRGTRSWMGAWDAATGEFAWRFFSIPAPGERGAETWLNDAWRTGGGGVWVTPAFDPVSNLVIYGTGDIFPSYDPEYRPGDNLFGASTLAVDVDTGELSWYFQATPDERWDLDTPSTRLIYSSLDGNTRYVANFERQGFYYTFDLDQSVGAYLGVFVRAVPFVDPDKINWTDGIDPKTGLPIEYDPTLVTQLYKEGIAGGGLPRSNLFEEGDEINFYCPTFIGMSTGLMPPTFDPNRRVHYTVAPEGCIAVPLTDPVPMDEDFLGVRGRGWAFQFVSPSGGIVGMNVDTGERVAKATFPIYLDAGLVSTAGDLVFTGHQDGKVAAYDSDTLAELWSFNTGTSISAAPITYAVDGRQYVAIVAGGHRGSTDGIPGRGVLGSNMVIVFGLR